MLFFQDIASIEKPVIEAFALSTQYGTAVELLQILKNCSFDIKKLSDLVVSLAAKLVETTNDKQLPILFLALDATFDIFKKMDVANRCVVYKHFKKQFIDSTDAKCKGESHTLNISLKLL